MSVGSTHKNRARRRESGCASCNHQSLQRVGVGLRWHTQRSTVVQLNLDSIARGDIDGVDLDANPCPRDELLGDQAAVS
jgi:hypothetical protein